MNPKQKHIYLLLGNNYDAISSIAISCSDIYEEKIVVHHSRSINIGWQEIISGLNSSDLFEADLIENLSAPDQKIQNFVNELDSKTNHLILGSHLLINLIPRYLKALESSSFTIKLVFVHDFHGFANNHNNDPEKVNHLIVGDISKFELFTRKYQRLFIDFQEFLNFPFHSYNSLQRFSEINLSKAKQEKAIDKIKNITAPQPIEFTFPFLSDASRYFIDVLISNINDPFTHPIKISDVIDINNELSFYHNKENFIENSVLSKVVVWDKTNPHRTKTLQFDVTNKIQEFLIDLSQFHEIQRIHFYPAFQGGSIEIKSLLGITKSGKQITFAEKHLGIQKFGELLLLQAADSFIIINPGVFALAMESLYIKLRYNSFGNQLTSFVQQYGSPKINFNKLLLPKKPSKKSDVSHHNIERAVIVNKKGLYIKGWIFHEEGNKFDLFLKLNGISYPIPINKKRIDVTVQMQESNENENCGFEFYHLLEEEEENLDLSLQVKTNKKEHYIHLDIIKLEHFRQLTFEKQYQFYLLSQAQSKVPQSIESENIKFSIIVPVYNVDPIYLNECIQSVINQIYTNWELCICDDKSTDPDTIDCLKYWANQNETKIKIKFSDKNQNISLASNAAIEMATGDYISLLVNDDTLTDDALLEVARSISKYPEASLIYSDEDKIEEDGSFSGPYFKSSFNPDLLKSNNYITHLSTIKKSVGDEIGWFRAGYEGAQDHDLMLRIMDHVPHDTILHIPKVLYHWRKIEGSTAANYDAKDYALLAGKKSLEDHLKRNKIKGTVKKGIWGGAFKINYNIAVPKKCSIIIPFKDRIEYLEVLIPSIIKNTSYLDYELLLIDNNSEKKETFEYLKAISKEYDHIKVIQYPGEFNYSAINNFGVSQTDAEYILLLNNDMKVINQHWLTNMISYLQLPEIGAVGAKLLYEDNTLQHAGVITGIQGSAGHAFKGRTNGTHYFNMGIEKNVAGVTAACLLTTKNIYNEVGGLDEEHFKVAYNDIDFCLKIRKKGYRILYTPHSNLYHYESKSRGYEDTLEKKERHDKEKSYLASKWGDFLLIDPYYNPNFSLEDQIYTLNI